MTEMEEKYPDTIEELWKYLSRRDSVAFSNASSLSSASSTSSFKNSSIPLLQSSTASSSVATSHEDIDEDIDEDTDEQRHSKFYQYWSSKPVFQSSQLSSNFTDFNHFDSPSLTKMSDSYSETAMTKLRSPMLEDESLFPSSVVVDPPSSSYSNLSPPPPEPLEKNVDKAIIKLCKNTDYPIIQRNGQRIYGSPPPNWGSKPPPEKGTEVFVGKIPRDCYEDELVPLFSAVGTIYELRLMMDFSGSNRGYLFVKFSTPAEAKRAIAELNNTEIRPGKRIGVCKSVDNRKLWISGLPKDRTVEEIQADLEKKTSGVTKVILYPCQTDKSKTRPYAFVEYENHRAAALARRKLVPGRIFILDHEIEKVDWAQPEVEVDQEIMNKVQNLFIRNISPMTSEAKIGEIFENLSGGKLERVRKTKDFAFVHFQSRESAEIALSKAQNLFVDGCLLDVSWSKPVDKDIYNTRKELTKLFSTGIGSGFDGPIPPSPNFSIRGISPRKRGAAGIRGLGAPGTNPPRAMILKMLYFQQNLRNSQLSLGGDCSQTGGGHFPHQLPTSSLASAPDYYNQQQQSLEPTPIGRPIQKQIQPTPSTTTGADTPYIPDNGELIYYPVTYSATTALIPGQTAAAAFYHYALGYPAAMYGRYPIPAAAYGLPGNYIDPHQLANSMYQMSINN